MTKQEKLECLKAYIDSIDRLPEHALFQGVSFGEMKTIVEMIYEILTD